MNQIIVRCLTLGVASLTLTGVLASPKGDETTIISFSRHTFRGVANKMGPQKISLSDYDIELSVPNLSYTKNATPRGLNIRRGIWVQKARPALMPSLSVKQKKLKPVTK